MTSVVGAGPVPRPGTTERQEAVPGAAVQAAGGGPRGGTLMVVGAEVRKLRAQARLWLLGVVCVGGPFLVALGLSVQSAVPQDTLFGRWVHDSGFALPLVVLSFTGQWVVPALASVVAGDIFASEDSHGTWKTLLTRACSRRQVFAGKALVSVAATVSAVAVLALSALLAGLTSGAAPLVGLNGQSVPPATAAGLVMLSWLSVVPGAIAYTALAWLLSVGSRNVAVGVAGPVLIGLVLQLLSLLDTPPPIRLALLSTTFTGWHGLWTQTPFTTDIGYGVLTAAVWTAACTVFAYRLLARRSVAAL